MESEHKQCIIEWTINLPVILEYINVIIIHDFLLRVYLTTTQQLESKRGYLQIYTASMACFYISA